MKYEMKYDYFMVTLSNWVFLQEIYINFFCHEFSSLKIFFRLELKLANFLLFKVFLILEIKPAESRCIWYTILREIISSESYIDEVLVQYSVIFCTEQ